jgi:exodeoxyribonuclease VII large subunit
VKAEVSRPTRAASGHLYFTLKDDTATLDAVCWRGGVAKLTTMPEEGLEVIVTGRISTYPGHSKYQIVVQDVEIAGEGAILKQLEERRRRLYAEGLFDAELKKPIPAMPQVIGVVTSPTGAVIRDILHRISERFPVHVLVWPVLVQGETAAAEIAAAIKGFDSLIDSASEDLPCPDTVIVARGGGSLEDLMAFNDEAVVRAAAACRLPLISAVGHETDTTLIDHAADSRAPTPTAAAEMATPVAAEIKARLSETEGRITRAMGRRIEDARERVRALERALSDPGMVIESRGQRFDYVSRSLEQAVDSLIRSREGKVRQLGEHLVAPLENIARTETRIEVMFERMKASMRKRIDTAGQRLEQASLLLDSTSFQKTLDRGFAIVSTAEGKTMRRAAEASGGQAVSIRFADGQRDAVMGPDDKPKPKKSGRKKASSGQDDLF